MDAPVALWVYLSTTPLLWLTLTVVIWVFADWLAQRSGRNPLVNPVMLAIAAVSAILLATGTSYGTYFDGAQFVHFLLGPTTVAIAIPLYKNWPIVRRKALPMLAALIAGTATSIFSAIAVAAAFGVPRAVLISLAPKSVTAPVAVLGAVIVTPLMNAMGLRDYAARGFAAGLAAHGIGTARAFVVDPVAGTFAGIAMGLSAILSSLLIPVIVRLLFPTA
jgi:putative effector of murein hydrolase